MCSPSRRQLPFVVLNLSRKLLMSSLHVIMRRVYTVGGERRFQRIHEMRDVGPIFDPLIQG